MKNSWRIIRVVAIALIGIAFGPQAAGGQTTEELVHELQRQNDLLRERIEAQDRRISSLEVDRTAFAEAAAGEVGAKSRGGVPLEVSGFLKTDAIVSSSRMNSTDAPRFAVSEPAGSSKDDSQFTSTVQHSRFELRLLPVEVGSATVSGLVKVIGE